MRRPPLLTFLTFNRLGNTIPSLRSLLESTDDFELYLLDNFSQDKTWDYLNSVSDPRIVYRERSDKNIGGVLLNKALIHRKPDQDWFNYEYDCFLITIKFISIFQDIFDNESNIAGLCGNLPGIIPKGVDDTQLIKVNNYRIYKSHIMGYCMGMRYEVMNKLGYLDEVTYGMDMDLYYRIDRMLHMKTGYSLDAHCLMVGIPTCDMCTAGQKICLGDKICTKYYSRVLNDFYSQYNPDMVKRVKESINKDKLYCDTIYNPNTSLTIEEQKVAKENIDNFSNIYNKFLNTLKENI